MTQQPCRLKGLTPWDGSDRGGSGEAYGMDYATARRKPLPAPAGFHRADLTLDRHMPAVRY
jgi:hypothetical protein